MNWKAAPGVTIVKSGLSVSFNPFHVEVTPSNVTCVALTDPAPVGTRLSQLDSTLVPVTTYCQPVL